MIPLTIAEEIRTTLLDYLTITFSFQDQACGFWPVAVWRETRLFLQ
jgi:hypothetical protein